MVIGANIGYEHVAINANIGVWRLLIIVDVAFLLSDIHDQSRLSVPYISPPQNNNRGVEGGGTSLVAHNTNERKNERENNRTNVLLALIRPSHIVIPLWKFMK